MLAACPVDQARGLDDSIQQTTEQTVAINLLGTTGICFGSIWIHLVVFASLARGITERSRSVAVAAANGGKECSSEDPAVTMHS